MHRHGAVFERLTVEVMAELPTDEARREVLEPFDVTRTDLVPF
ncbi:hypothetical protein OG742_30315 [Streptomyces sp. NBC_00828]